MSVSKDAACWNWNKRIEIHKKVDLIVGLSTLISGQIEIYTQLLLMLSGHKPKMIFPSEIRG
jgi:hypothetical protein